METGIKINPNEIKAGKGKENLGSMNHETVFKLWSGLPREERRMFMKLLAQQYKKPDHKQQSYLR